jgi:hypothetical protein
VLEAGGKAISIWCFRAPHFLATLKEFKRVARGASPVSVG